MPGGFTNPFEYRETMYELFFNGKPPEAKAPPPASAPRRGRAPRQRGPQRTTPSAPPRSAVAQLAALNKRSEQLRDKRTK